MDYGTPVHLFCQASSDAHVHRVSLCDPIACLHQRGDPAHWRIHATITGNPPPWQSSLPGFPVVSLTSHLEVRRPCGFLIPSRVRHLLQPPFSLRDRTSLSRQATYAETAKLILSLDIGRQGVGKGPDPRAPTLGLEELSENFRTVGRARHRLRLATPICPRTSILPIPSPRSSIGKMLVDLSLVIITSTVR